MENIEIKVRVPTLDVVKRALGNISVTDHGSIHQIDTYFSVNHGRLKLREETGPKDQSSAILISYLRPDDTTSRISQYRLQAVSEPEELRAILSASLGVLIQVRKTRHLYICGQTRIHLDDVDSLGSFVELETVIADQPLDVAWAEHRSIRTNLALDEYEPIEFSYSDLMLQRIDHQPDRERNR